MLPAFLPGILGILSGILCIMLGMRGILSGILPGSGGGCQAGTLTVHLQSDSALTP